MAVANVPDQAEYGGYDFTFTKPVPDKFYCSICAKVLRDPHLTECCGQHFCESCLKHWFKKQKNTCLHCRHKNFIHILNKPLKREVDELEIRCTKQGVGCQWVGELSSLQAHLDSDKGCGYVEVQCSNKCGSKMKRKDLVAHLGWQCPLRKMTCKYCYYEDTYQTINTQHYKKCLSYPLPCPNKCGTTDIQRADMANHRSKCELEPVECPFHEAGCTARVVRREFDAHMSGSQQNHLLALLGAFQQTKRKLSESQRLLGECQRKLSEVEAMKSPPATLKTEGDEVTFCMTDFSMHKQNGNVWYSPPFYFRNGYKLCLAVYANGKGAGAGTHVSVELLQMRGEHDDNLTWLEGKHGKHMHKQSLRNNISIQMMEQSLKIFQKNAFSLEGRLMLCCTKRLSPHENLRVCDNISDDHFIDHKSAELMVLNDTIVLKISYI